jgi:hypothetical protein
LTQARIPAVHANLSLNYGNTVGLLFYTLKLIVQRASRKCNQAIFAGKGQETGGNGSEGRKVRKKKNQENT